MGACGNLWELRAWELVGTMVYVINLWGTSVFNENNTRYYLHYYFQQTSIFTTISNNLIYKQSFFKNFYNVYKLEYYDYYMYKPTNNFK